MKTTIESDVENRSTEAVALIDAWLNEHGWWADTRAIDLALDVRAILSDPTDTPEVDGAHDEASPDDDLVGAST